VTTLDYGMPPSGYRLPDATRLGGVRLQVADLERSLAFYQTVLGLAVRDQTATTATLTPQGAAESLVELVEKKGARPSGMDRRLGLFHFAILLPTRAYLAAFVRHANGLGVQLGAGDHVVSEAFYLHDPDGLGIEVYADRPRAGWRAVNRQLVMGTDPVDIANLLASSAASWNGTPAETVMGHVHLHVGEIARASAFYSEALGFDRIVWNYPGALFLAAGGYHHHLGTNTWAGSGARNPSDDDARLLEWTIVVPSAADVAAVAAHLEAAGHAAHREDNISIVTRDPWDTPVRIRTA
jgi:catechol 2,3-dioxygenase